MADKWQSSRGDQARTRARALDQQVQFKVRWSDGFKIRLIREPIS